LKHRIALCAALAALGVAGATSAQAQPIYVEPPRGYVAVSPPTMEPMVEGLPPQEILMIVRASGLRPLTQPARRGGRYLILASDNMGGQLRVVINAHTGRIVDASPAHDSRFGEPPMRPRGLVPVPDRQQEAEAPPQDEPPPSSDLRTPSAPPRPPRVARTTPASQTPPAGRSSNRSLATTPDVTGSVPPARPARTPLPRPRPAATQQAAAPPPAAEASATPAPQAQPAVRETSPEAEQPAAAAPAPAAPRAAPATPPASETQMVPVAPLD
jgi:hypothetical protein